MSTYGEIYPRILERTGEQEFRGKRRWLVTPSAAKSLAESVYGTNHPDESGTWAPRCHGYQIVKDFGPDEALVVAFYKTFRIPGYATLEFRIWSDYERRQIDEDGLIIEGPDDSMDWQQWRVVEGSNEVPVPRCQIIVKTAAETFNPDEVMDRVGHVNDSQLTNFGNAGRKGALLLLGAPQTRYWREGKLWYINYAMAYSGPDKIWNETCKSRMGAWVSQMAASFNVEGTVVNDYAPNWKREFMYKLIREGDDGTVSATDTQPAQERKLFPEASFSELNGYLEWIVTT